ncbi:hypothetical protein NAI64_03945 [Oxalobacter sp. OxGP1]|uniref:glycosyltransferase family 9 protein n=1 Tax=Oxalobacter paeniformigenes TaxID=2946594 RepID=UPI0022AF0FED|nr:hypothetical protein [Oxalobacter paeniformigenes]MCZ4052875.1 hypothetical protein [Oxalobacter paeniformigenes]
MRKYLEDLQRKIKNYSVRKGITAKQIAIKLVVWNIKFLFRKIKKKSEFSGDIFHVAIIPQAGVGDFVYAAKYIYCLKKKFDKNISIDVYVDHNFEVAECFWRSASYINSINTQKNNKCYDCEIEICRFPCIQYLDKNRLLEIGNSQLKEYFEFIDRFQAENELLYQSDYLGRCYSILNGRKCENQADIADMLNMTDANKFIIKTKEDFEILSKFGLTKDRYIVIQTGPGLHFKGVNDVRQWPIEYYVELVGKLKLAYPDVKILQVGEVYHKPVLNADINLLGKTSFLEMLVILKWACILIAQDGGMPILRHFTSRKSSCIFFGPTDKNFYGFDENINLSANVCAGCEWLTEDWYLNCVNKKKSLCMKSILPNLAFEKIKMVINKALGFN